ncbi:MAG: tRNA (adenosine(37)-N6)-dimethylallyltransferase MiaA [Rhodothermales bacterium]|nr:tRNA (adenosine(37)-N6)-dimethylallyltransferase MiaA [Rhodothermales bacterium]MBO6781601.1 tRNA (adenosine(37)-N6)-dimethylallyltransferase MiaA [Rhodothermales bacterium]
MIPLITGPTAVGKTAVVLKLAGELDGEIVSCDSRQLYAELNVGTAKPTQEELAAVPHHFIGEATVGDPWSAGRYARVAEERIAQILDRGRSPVVVGGSTLYIQALVEGLADIPATDPAVRAALNEKLETVGPAVLFQALERVDPAFASTLDPTKSQRIVRGLEVYASTGRPLSSFFEDMPPPRFSYGVVVLDRERERLYARIDERVHAMIEAGLIEELHRLMEAGYDPEANPLRTIGYSELVPFVRGERSLDESIALIQRNSRRYAKRQLTWFRGRDDWHWLPLDGFDSVDATCAAVRQRLGM